MHDGPQTTTGTAYMVIGFFLGGPCSAIFLNTAKELPEGVAILVALTFPVIGIFLGWIFAVAINQQAIRDYEQERRKNVPVNLAPQIVGKNCCRCDSHLLMKTDGHFCTVCHQIFCVECEPTSPCSNCDGNH